MRPSGVNATAVTAPPASVSGVERGELPNVSRVGSSVGELWLPSEQVPLESCDDATNEQDARGQDRHTCEDAGRIENSFGLSNQIADPSRGAQILPDDHGNDGHPDADMEAGENPRQRTRHEDMAYQLSL